MTKKDVVLSRQVKALKTTDLTPFINMSGLMAPRMMKVFFDTLDQKQRNVINKVMPQGRGKKMFFHLVGSATPPIVIEMAQPLKMMTLSENEVKLQKIKGIKVKVEDVQLVTERKIGKFLWRIKSQLGTMVGLTGMFTPFIKLGPKGIMELKNKAMAHFKPLLDLMPQ
jgi:hypothetical protein